MLGMVAARADDASSARLSALRILDGRYPMAFFFRGSEVAARRGAGNFEEWAAEFSRLGGIMGKCLDEEVPGTMVRNPDGFVRFKERFPDQAVLLHFNGNARDPLF